MLRTISWLTLVTCCFLFVPVSHAEVLKKDRYDVIQLKLTKKRRHEFAPFAGLTINDAFLQVYAAGLSYTYHISEGLGFELMGAFARASTTDIVDSLRKGDVLIDPGNLGEKKVFNPEFSRPQIYAFGNFVLTPFIGKFALGKYVFDMDIYMFLGAGFVRTDLENLVGTDLGIGMRVFLLSWLTLRMEFRDMIYSQKPQSATILSHNLFFTLSLGFLLPTRPVYTF